jgi:hypothetical protein
VSYNYDPDDSFTPRHGNSSNVELYERPFNTCEFQTIFEQETNLYFYYLLEFISIYLIKIWVQS